jgi:hypothetical protein
MERPILHATDPDHGNPSRAYCDPRLYQVHFRDWTGVHIKDSLAAGAVSYYLETDYPIHGLFDADLFLHDFASGEKHFCSAMLVNAILGWSCVCRWCSVAKVSWKSFLTEYSNHTVLLSRPRLSTELPSSTKVEDSGSKKTTGTRSRVWRRLIS